MEQNNTTKKDIDLWKRTHYMMDLVENIDNNLIEKIHGAFNLCRDLTSDYDDSHDIEHHFNVLHNAVTIYSKFLENPVDIFLKQNNCYTILVMISVSSLLHDIIDHKYPTELEQKNKEINNYLEKNFDEEIGKNIRWIIDNVSYSKEVKLGCPRHNNYLVQIARHIVSDADKIEALGLIGLDRARKYAIIKNPDAPNDVIMKLVVQHCHDKLLKLKDFYMRTVHGQELAAFGHGVIVGFVEADKIFNGG